MSNTESIIKKLPKFFPLSIVEEINKRAAIVFRDKIHNVNATNNFEIIISAFLSKDIESIWKDVSSYSEEIARSLAIKLLYSLDDFNTFTTLKNKSLSNAKIHQKYISDLSRIRKKYSSIMPWSSLHLLDELNTNIKRAQEHQMIFEDSTYFDEMQSILPLTRKNKIENAKSIFLIRILYKFFSEHLKNPKYKYIQQFIFVIFNYEYTEHEIIDLTKDIRIT